MPHKDSLHRMPEKPSEPINRMRLRQRRSSMMRDQHKEIDTAQYSHSAVLHRLGLGFYASTQTTTD
jgi:hypothetical protein